MNYKNKQLIILARILLSKNNNSPNNFNTVTRSILINEVYSKCIVNLIIIRCAKNAIDMLLFRNLREIIKQ